MSRRRLRGTLRALRGALLAAAALLAVSLALLLTDWIATPARVAWLAAAVAALAIAAAWLARRLPPRIALAVDLEQGIVEHVPEEAMARLALRDKLLLRDVTDALERAVDDPRVVGLVARIGPHPLGLATAQELRDAVHAFRRKGKRAVAYAETLGESGTATAAYYLASAFDEVHLQPTGDLAFTGLHAATPFARGLLDRLGVKPRLDHRREYKTARYLFTETEMLPPHREMVADLLASQSAQVVRGVAEDRRLDEARVRELIDRAPLFADEAQAAGLVDSVAYPDEVRRRVEEAWRGESVPLRAYLARAGRPHRRGPRVALVHAVGAVSRGRSRMGFPGGLTMGSDDVVAALRSAAEDRKVRAVVLRVDTPGGSAVASDAIRRAVERTRAAGKPVVVSMGDVAASGGYYLAASADRIVAQPGTLTGSIGVVAGKFVTREAWARAGVQWGTLGVGAHASLASPLEDYDAEGLRELQRTLDRVYEDFKARVAEGRRLSPERVEELAKGRVWTGAEAHAAGLVDALGGLDAALRLAREAAGLAPDARITVAPFPRVRRIGPFRRRRERDDLPAALLREVARPAAELARVADAAGVGHARVEMRMPPL